MSEHKGHRQRVRRRFLETGLSGFAPHEVLELLLFYAIPMQDVNPLAHRLLEHFGSLHGVLEATPAQLMQVDGISENTAVLLGMLLPVMGAYRQSALGEKPCLATAEARESYCRSLFELPGQEQLYLICLNARQEVIARCLLGEGHVGALETSARLSAQQALQYSARYALLCHNHPGGTLYASDADVEATARIAAALSAVGVPLLDHLIICGGDTFSFTGAGLITFDK